MKRISIGIFGGGAVLACLLAIVPAEVPGQAAKEMELDAPEKVRFDTPDGVKLHGTFFKSPTKAAPAVILVHNIGPKESSNKKDWIELAKTLQPRFSVLTFDLRGHGASVDIDSALYFHYPFNNRITKNAPKITKLDYRDISDLAYQVFINDISAAKSYLERTKNDLGMCNTQNTIVVGVEQGATLAAIWANSEWIRYKFETVTQPLSLIPQIRYENRPEGQYLTAFVGISMTPKLGKQTINLVRTLDVPCRVHGMPAVFVHGDGDPKDKDSMYDRKTAIDVDKTIRSFSKKGDSKLAYMNAVEVKGAGKLRGVDLLLKSLKTSEQLRDYLQTVVAENTQEWTQRDFVKSKFAWRAVPNVNVLPIPAKVLNIPPFPPSQLFPPGQPVPDAVEKNLIYDSYERFVIR